MPTIKAELSYDRNFDTEQLEHNANSSVSCRRGSDAPLRLKPVRPDGRVAAAARMREKGFAVDSSLNFSRSNAAEDDKKLDPFAEGYDTRSFVDKLAALPSRLRMSDWGCYVSPANSRKKGAQLTKVEQLVVDVCTKAMSMRQLKTYSPDSGFNCVMWMSSHHSRDFIRTMRKGSQIVGRVMCETLLKDKQAMHQTLRKHMFTEGIDRDGHSCTEKDVKTARATQRICEHQYYGHYMTHCMDQTAVGCPNRDYEFCDCFRSYYFLPEFYTFGHYSTMEQFLKRYETDPKFTKTAWLAKPGYLTSGKGFFLIRNASEFRYFFQVRSDSCVRREGYTLQRYISRTCTINNFKADCRMYLLVVVLNGRRVMGFFHPGYVRIASAAYTAMGKANKSNPTPQISDNVFEHMTSTDLHTIMAKASQAEDEDDDKERCMMFNDACELISTGSTKKVKKGDSGNLVPFTTDADGDEAHKLDAFHLRFKTMVVHLCSIMEPHIRNDAGTFQIFGLDVLIDSDAKPWLLEVNSHVATEQVYDANQAKVLSNAVTEALLLIFELMPKTLQEEEISMEIHQINERLKNLSRAKRLMTAPDTEKKLDELRALLKKTAITENKKPVTLKNYFWWYESEKARWLRPWVRAKRRREVQMPWYSRMFLSLIKREEALQPKNWRADQLTATIGDTDVYKHLFWPETLLKQMDDFEKNVLEQRLQAAGQRSTRRIGDKRKRFLTLASEDEQRKVISGL